ncbi:MAG: CHAP domain-containing protein [Pedobacter sp.]|nr:MAG: CHAP domain-containing protein [Pedobacter sp.]
MAKNHAFLGLLCIAFICIHFYPACYRVKPDYYAEPGSVIEQNTDHPSSRGGHQATKKGHGATKKGHGANKGGHGASADRSEILSKATAAKIKRVKAIYDAQVGVREQGHNAGRKVESYLAAVNLGKGHAWCAAFICWVYGQADIPNPQTGWSPSLFPSSKVIWQNFEVATHPKWRGQASKAKIPRTGDIFGIYFADKKRIAHAGFVDSWQSNWVITVEGNTNPEGYRDGDGVYRKKRLTKSLYTVARYIN